MFDCRTVVMLVAVAERVKRRTLKTNQDPQPSCHGMAIR